MFSERTGHAVIILGVEKVPNYSLNAYVRAFQKSNADKMLFSNRSRFFEKDGHQIWQASGIMIDNTSNRLNVQVVHLGTEFWRIITIQTRPYGYSDSLAAQLRDALWGTLKQTTTPKARTNI